VEKTTRGKGQYQKQPKAETVGGGGIGRAQRGKEKKHLGGETTWGKKTNENLKKLKASRRFRTKTQKKKPKRPKGGGRGGGEATKRGETNMVLGRTEKLLKPRKERNQNK